MRDDSDFLGDSDNGGGECDINDFLYLYNEWYLKCNFNYLYWITLCNSEFYTTMKLSNSGPFFGVDLENHVHFSM